MNDASYLFSNALAMLKTPNTSDLEKTSTGKLSYAGLVPAKRAARGLWVGNIVDSANIEFMQNHKIGVVVNCTRDLPFRFSKQIHMRLAVDDAYEHTLRLFEYWKTAVPRISRYLDSHQNVLIHCHAGQQRSFATAAAVLMYRNRHHNAVQVIQTLKGIKSDAFRPRVNFYRSLMRWQTWLKTHPPPRASRSL